MSTSDMYTDVSELGHVKTTIGLVIGVIVSIAFIAAGIYFSFYDKNNKHTKEVSAIIKNLISPCNSSYDKNNIQHVDCDLLIHYEYEGKSYDPIAPIHTTDGYKMIGGPITIYIDPSNPSDYSMSSLEMERKSGWVFIVLGLVILAMSVFMYWLSYRYKAFAALQGVGFGLGGLGGQRW
jgi:preprotein translocase subunit YajC